MRWVRYFGSRHNLLVELVRGGWLGIGVEWDKDRFGWRAGVRIGLAFVSAHFLFVSRNG